MTMVKSANDMAVVLAEGISGSVESFAGEMTRTARRLGMTQTNFVNPNGLPADAQVTSARDLAERGYRWQQGVRGRLARLRRFGWGQADEPERVESPA